jgi:hypothetical protein
MTSDKPGHVSRADSESDAKTRAAGVCKTPAALAACLSLSLRVQQ